MFYQTEAKPQCWRAVAVFEDRPDILLYLNRSSTQVRAGLRNAFFEVLDEEERAHAKAISLQRWHGAPDAGRWMHQSNLAIPIVDKVVMAKSALDQADLDQADLDQADLDQVDLEMTEVENVAQIA